MVLRCAGQEKILFIIVAQYSQLCCACSLAWKRVSPSICSNDDIKLQLVDRVCPGVDLSSPTNFCKMFGVCHQSEMHEESQQTASDRQFWAWRALAFSLSRLQMLTYFQSLDLLGVQQDP